MKIVKLPQAFIDLVETADYLAEEDISVSDRFFDAFELTLEDLRRSPKIGIVRKFKNHIDIRMWFVRDFKKSLIFYTENTEEIVILRIIHSARDYKRFLKDD